jgi:hypothetical protein
MRTVSKPVVPFHAILPPATPRRVSRRFNGGRLHGGLGALGAGVANPVGAGSGTGAVEGASTGASIGSAIVPGIGTAVGAIVGAAAGAIAGAFNKTDPENADFNQAVAIWNQNPNAVYAIRNPYLALAGLFDLNLTTNVPIYKKFGRMGEQAFTWWLVNLVYQAAQAGQIGPDDTALTIMSNIVQPQIDSWGYGPMADPHADLINKLIVTMILQYTEGLQGNWDAVSGAYPSQFNSIPPFSLPAPAASTSLKTVPASPAGSATPVSAGVAETNMPNRPASGSFSNGATITPSSGTYIGDGAGEWYFGPDVISAANGSGNAFYLYTNQPNYVNGAGIQATVANGQVYLQNAAGQWSTYNGVSWSAVPNVPALNTAATQANAAAAATATPQPPPLPSTVLSSDGSTVSAPGTALETSNGTYLYFGPQATGDPDNAYGYPVWENQASQSPVHVATLAGLLMMNGGKIYGVTTPGGWFALVNNTWQPIASAPTVTTAATTSTVASPQATQACTPATTGGGSVATTNPTTGGVVGTTTSGDAITDSDIQSLIDQMSSQNATATQTYDAVMSALESSGASITTGLSNQVAAQVSASTPAPTAAAGGDTGLYIVGGGLALLALLWFSRKRA